LAISTADDWPSTTLLTLDLLHLMRLTSRQKSRFLLAVNAAANRSLTIILLSASLLNGVVVLSPSFAHDFGYNPVARPPTVDPHSVPENVHAVKTVVVAFKILQSAN